MLLNFTDLIVKNTTWNNDVGFYWIGLRKRNNKLAWYDDDTDLTYSNWYNLAQGKKIAVCIYQVNV